MLSLAASLTQKWKQTATFTSRLKMPLGTTSERLAPRFRLAQGGVRFGKQYLVGQRRSFHSGVKTAHALKIREPHLITVTGKVFMILAMRLPIIQTGEARRKVTRCGKFIR